MDKIEVVVLIIITVAVVAAILVGAQALSQSMRQGWPPARETYGPSGLGCQYEWAFCATVDAKLNIILTQMPK